MIVVRAAFLPPIILTFSLSRAIRSLSFSAGCGQNVCRVRQFRSKKQSIQLLYRDNKEIRAAVYYQSDQRQPESWRLCAQREIEWTDRVGRANIDGIVDHKQTGHVAYLRPHIPSLLPSTQISCFFPRMFDAKVFVAIQSAQLPA